VSDTSRSADAVTKAMTLMTLSISKMAADRKTLTVSGGVNDIHADDTVTVARGTESQPATVASVTAPDTIVLNAALSGATDFTGGTVTGTFTVRVLVASAKIQAFSADRSQVTLDIATHRFAAGDAIHVTGAAATDTFVTDATGAVLTVAPPLAARNAVGDDVRSADLAANTRRLRQARPLRLGRRGHQLRGDRLHRRRPHRQPRPARPQLPVPPALTTATSQTAGPIRARRLRSGNAACS
jgi:hypothetical protein